MDYSTLSTITSILTATSLIIATHLLTPKAYKEWKLWGKTEKTIHLSNFALLSFLSTGIFLGILLRFLRILVGM